MAGDLTRSLSARSRPWPVGPARKQDQVARDLGVSPYSVSRWKKLYGGGGGEPASGAQPFTTSAPGVSVARSWNGASVRLERENADLREQRTILKKAVAIFSEPPR